MPTIMEKEQGETSSPGKSTAPAKQAVDRQNSLSLPLAALSTVEVLVNKMAQVRESVCFIFGLHKKCQNYDCFTVVGMAM